MKDWLEKKNKQLMIWAAGINGRDELGSCCYIIGIILLLINLLVRSGVLNVLCMLLVAYSVFRFCSKRVIKRSEENRRFIAITEPVRRRCNLIKLRLTYRKSHKYYLCPGCRQMIRVPKGKGKIEISCPKCRTAFIRRT